MSDEKGDALFEAFVSVIGDSAEEPHIARLIKDGRALRKKMRELERADNPRQYGQK